METTANKMPVNVEGSTVPDRSGKKPGKEEKSKRKDDKSVDQVMKGLNNLETTEEKLAAMCKKFAEVMDENRKLQLSAKQFEKGLNVVQREKEQLQTDHSKAVLTRSRLESLCRELQRQNKAVKEESLLKVREEEEKRKEVSAKFNATLAEITSLMSSSNEKTNKLRDENLDITKKFKSICEQNGLQQQQVDKMTMQRKLEAELSEAKLTKQRLEFTAEKEILLREKQQLLMDLQEARTRMCDLNQNESALKSQVALYSDRYEEFQNALSRSNEVFGGFKGEMDKMSKKILKLEKETMSWKNRWEKSHQALLEMATDKQQRDAELALAQRQLAQLEKLCRTLQKERTGLLAQIKGAEKPSEPAVEGAAASSNSIEINADVGDGDLLLLNGLAKAEEGLKLGEAIEESVKESELPVVPNKPKPAVHGTKQNSKSGNKSNKKAKPETLGPQIPLLDNSLKVDKAKPIERKASDAKKDVSKNDTLVTADKSVEPKQEPIATTEVAPSEAPLGVEKATEELPVVATISKAAEGVIVQEVKETPTVDSVVVAQVVESEKAPVVEQAARSQKAPAVAKTAEILKAPVVAKASEISKAPVVAEAAESPKVPVVAKAAESPKAPVVAQAPERPKAPVVAKAAEMSKAPVVAQAPESPKAPVVVKSDESPKTPVVAQAPESPKAPVVAQAEETSKAPVIKPAPEITKAPVASSTESPKAPVVAKPEIKSPKGGNQKVNKKSKPAESKQIDVVDKGVAVEKGKSTDDVKPTSPKVEAVIETKPALTEKVADKDSKTEESGKVGVAKVSSEQEVKVAPEKSVSVLLAENIKSLEASVGKVNTALKTEEVVAPILEVNKEAVKVAEIKTLGASPKIEQPKVEKPAEVKEVKVNKPEEPKDVKKAEQVKPNIAQKAKKDEEKPKSEAAAAAPVSPNKVISTDKVKATSPVKAVDTKQKENKKEEVAIADKLKPDAQKLSKPAAGETNLKQEVVATDPKPSGSITAPTEKPRTPVENTINAILRVLEASIKQKQLPKEAAGGASETAKETPKLSSLEPIKEAVKEPSASPPKGPESKSSPAKEPTKPVAKDAAKEGTKNQVKGTANEGPKVPLKETSKDAAKNSAASSPKNAPKSPKNDKVTQKLPGKQSTPAPVVGNKSPAAQVVDGDSKANVKDSVELPAPAGAAVDVAGAPVAPPAVSAGPMEAKEPIIKAAEPVAATSPATADKVPPTVQPETADTKKIKEGAKKRKK